MRIRRRKIEESARFPYGVKVFLKSQRVHESGALRGEPLTQEIGDLQADVERRRGHPVRIRVVVYSLVVLVGPGHVQDFESACLPAEVEPAQEKTAALEDECTRLAGLSTIIFHGQRRRSPPLFLHFFPPDRLY